MSFAPIIHVGFLSMLLCGSFKVYQNGYLVEEMMMKTTMKELRQQYDLSYDDIAVEADVPIGDVFAVELGHPLFKRDQARVTAALDRLIERKKAVLTEQATVPLPVTRPAECVEVQ